MGPEIKCGLFKNIFLLKSKARVIFSVILFVIVSHRRK